MKFPYKLSKERYSLLNEEDKRIYDMEHSLYENMIREKTEQLTDISEPLEEPDEDELTDDEKQEFYELFDAVIYDTIMNLYGDELKEDNASLDYKDLQDEVAGIYEFLKNDDDSQNLNEAEGWSADYWIPGFGWLGKFAVGTLTGLLGVIVWLIMKGKDRIAMDKLKRYMNRLVELTDQGLYKKRPWYSFLIPNKDTRINTGEYNRGCFRTIQETEERNLACLYTSTVHALGFYSPETTSFETAALNGKPEPGSGLDIFRTKILSRLNLND